MDIQRDNGFMQWCKIAELIGDANIPSYVSQYTAPDEKKASDLSDTLYADDARRMFPIDTPASTWLSAAYFAYNRDGLPYKRATADFVANALLKAAETHGIVGDVEKCVQAITAGTMAKQAADADSDYCLVRRAESGEVVTRKYRVTDPEMLKEAAAYFSENRFHYPAEVRREIASNLVKKAVSMSVSTGSLPTSVLREAGHGLPDKQLLMNELLERAHLIKDAGVSAQLAGLVEAVHNASPEELLGGLDKIAEVVDAVDTATGLSKHYGRKLLSPADFTHSIAMDKAAQDLEDIIELDKLAFDAQALLQIPAEFYARVCGQEFVDASKVDGLMDKMAFVKAANALTKIDKSVLERAILTICA